MNAPDRSTAHRSTPSDRSAASRPGGSHNLDDVAALFPGMEVFHDLRITGQGDTALLCSLSGLLNSQGARIVNLSLRGCGETDSSIKCRLSGLTASRANDLVTRLTAQPAVSAARVEHVILRSR